MTDEEFGELVDELENADRLSARIKARETLMAAWQAARRTVSGQEAEPIGYVTQADADRLHTYKGTIWPSMNEAAIIPVYLAAPLPERADADTAGANPGWLHVDEVKALCRDFSSRTGNVYIKDVESALDGLAALPSADPTYPASERADAGKDAARYRWILENADVLFKRAEFFNGIYSHYPATHEVSEAIDAAILAANKEPK
jgi:hypothetical protein